MSVWGKPAVAGAWADNVEEEEAAGALAPPAPKAFLAGQSRAAADDFPDLAVAAKVKESKKDKKKKAAKQTLSLNDFLKTGSGGGASVPFGAGRRLGGGGGGDVDLLSLPTAPRPREEGEERPDRPLGGGFREYGGREGGRGRYGDDERGPRREGEEDMGPSRAEMSDNWGSDRKFAGGGGGDDRGRGGFGGGFREREGGFRDRSREPMPDGPSRADEVDDWGKSKQFVPSSRGGFEDRPRHGGGVGGGSFRDRSPPAFREPSKADTEDRWSRGGGADFKPTAFEDRPRREFDDRAPPRRGFGFAERDGSRDASRERWERAAPRDGSRDARPTSRDARPRSRDISQEATWRRADAPAAAPGADGPTRERRRLNLAPRTAPAEAAGDAVAPAAAKPSVFGAARPREEVLREQGRDAVKEDLALEHEAVDRPETAEERALRREVANLQIRVEAGEADAEYEGEGDDGDEGKEGEGEEEEAPTRTVAQALAELEGRLQRLQLELDSRAKYARAAPAADQAKERRAREPSPAADGGWRRAAPAAAEGANGGPTPRAFRDERPARLASNGGSEEKERPPRKAGPEERGRRDNFPPRDREAAAEDKPRW